MIRGIGVDIIEIDRFRKSIEKYGESFLKKLFTEEEIRYCRSKTFPAQHFAARFSAKEALSKALATGYAGEFEWKNVEVTNNPAGKPDFIFHRNTAETLKESDVYLSMSHSDTSVVAFVVIEKKKSAGYGTGDL